MKLASVILDIPTQALTDAYTYAAPLFPAAEDKPVEVGCVVVVPFGARRAIGFVIEVWEEELAGKTDTQISLFGEVEKTEQAPKNLKYIEQVVSDPYFDEKGAACAQWLAKEYVAPLSACIRLFMPPGAIPRMVPTRLGAWRLEEPRIGEVDDRWVRFGPEAKDYIPRKNAIRQIQILDALSKGELRVAELTAEFGSVSAPLKTLESKGVVVVEHRRRLRGFEDSVNKPDLVHDKKLAELGEQSPVVTLNSKNFTPSKKPDLTEGQANALRVISNARNSNDGAVVLVDGVTGSGKTEVYLQAIEDVLNEGKSSIVLVPEISLTPQTVARFRGRFGDLVAVMHSRMSQGERYDQWDFIRSGIPRVVVGARSALFTPMKNIGLIVIDEEHEGTYKQDSAPRYHARDVALWMAKQNNACVVLGSATPSLESLHAAENDPMWHYASLPERANKKPLPQVTVLDMAQEFSNGSRSMFSRKLSKALYEELAAGHKVVLLLNQRGFAKFVLCRDCGYVPMCPSCSVALTFHEKGNTLMCHHCGYKIEAPARCPECNSPYLKKFGAGTQRVETDLRILLDSFELEDGPIPIIRMDADTTSKKGAHQKLLDQFASEKAAVLLGTQMIAKGLDFDDVTLVGVINADTILRLPDFRAAERTFDLIEQVAGRAGRGALPGRVMVQTYEADAVPIVAAAHYDREYFLKDELMKRKLLHYPPYVRLSRVLIWGNDEDLVANTAQQTRHELDIWLKTQDAADHQIFDATPCALSKLRNTYRWNILIKSSKGAPVSEILDPFFRARKPIKGVSVAVDVDPESLL